MTSQDGTADRPRPLHHTAPRLFPSRGPQAAPGRLLPADSAHRNGAAQQWWPHPRVNPLRHCCSSSCWCSRSVRIEGSAHAVLWTSMRSRPIHGVGEGVPRSPPAAWKDCGLGGRKRHGGESEGSCSKGAVSASEPSVPNLLRPDRLPPKCMFSNAAHRLLK